MNFEEQSLGELRRHWESRRDQALERKRLAEEALEEAGREMAIAQEKLGHILALLSLEETEAVEIQKASKRTAMGNRAEESGETDHEKTKRLLIELIITLDGSARLALKDFMRHLETQGHQTTKGTLHRVLHELVDDGFLIKTAAEPGRRVRFVYRSAIADES